MMPCSIIINLFICNDPLVNMVPDESEALRNLKLKSGAKLDIESGTTLESSIQGLDL